MQRLFAESRNRSFGDRRRERCLYTAHRSQSSLQLDSIEHSTYIGHRLDLLPMSSLYLVSRRSISERMITVLLMLSRVFAKFFFLHVCGMIAWSVCGQQWLWRLRSSRLFCVYTLTPLARSFLGTIQPSDISINNVLARVSDCRLEKHVIG